MKKLITLVLLVWVSTGHAEITDRQPLNATMYRMMVLPLLHDLELILNVNLRDNLPTVYVAPREQIMQAYCPADTACSVIAVTDRNTGEIYLTNGFMPNNLVMASILFHELVHWVQVTKGWYRHDSDCLRWAQQEQQAYRIQSQWLVAQGAKPIEVPNLVLQCK